MRPRRGLTLVEVLLVLALLGVLAGALFAISLTGRQLYFSSETSVHVQQQARQAFDAMARELRQAQGSTLTVAGSQCTFQVALGYNLASPCPVNAVCWGANDQAGAVQSGWSVRYRLNGTQLLREVLNSQVPPVVQSTRVLANDVTQLTFSYVGGGTNTVTIQLQVLQSSTQLPGGSLGTGATPLTMRLRLRNP